MFIQTEQTPNPATLKFLPGRTVLEAGTADFANAEEAECRSPLASHLFGIEGVAGVFLGADFISITKSADKEWHVLKPAILGAIMEHMTTGLPIISDVPATEASDVSGEDSDVVVQIKELLETRVRPAVAQDGGDIVFEGFDSVLVGFDSVTIRFVLDLIGFGFGLDSVCFHFAFSLDCPGVGMKSTWLTQPPAC